MGQALEKINRKIHENLGRREKIVGQAGPMVWRIPDV
jgi:hypothetical protein